MYHIFTHSSVDGHLGCFHALAVTNSAAMGCVYLFEFEFMQTLFKNFIIQKKNEERL